MIPFSIDELMHRVIALNGMTVGELASALNIPLPYNTKNAKGYIGQLAEIALGATAGAKPVQDFINLNVELKTIPLLKNCRPAQNTHVCILEHQHIRNQTFENSNFYNKIKQVLWLPVEGDPSIIFAERHFGTGFLWHPDDRQYRILRDEWEEIMEFIAINGIKSITSDIGENVLLAPCGGTKNNYQYGFYLRKSFTAQIIDNFLSELS
ncbi:MAG: DNA mismatch repair protein MutH [Ruminobacter sp.]|jgi:DNA mismatch repair protein MutH|uniref:MutH/Sau3AI family endonuclease n=1 Tax=Ruminobacter TaxID=866 RepID=UPI00257DFFA9|nr:MutH/Sau3AI family endonuclease [Ruminobacter sp.]MBQ3774662.1 DNA mismatch repair protein MutH [Ruminobacter sp.]